MRPGPTQQRDSSDTDTGIMLMVLHVAHSASNIMPQCDDDNNVYHHGASVESDKQERNRQVLIALGLIAWWRICCGGTNDGLLRSAKPIEQRRSSFTRLALVFRSSNPTCQHLSYHA